ncbi:AAA family ATPase [Mycobacterium crocinum]|uniref:AAA family ATPase n=1 Tax=Mycolicibacterium crocinum TaxID=388459 RepID=A0ABY3TQJ6_9MYCO|nr:AAA family ATPase [Mycolicibacterium crocinum]MCV7218971.1 AAA family ATPase [Mycolicibacterium crocinum]ULN43736.1 AAA family ATPase [Mycolicibacterium crocinum]
MTTPVLDLDGRVVDRRQEIDELRAAVAAAGRTGGGCLLFSGAPGVGKSTLIQAFGIEASKGGCVFAYGRCRADAPAPYSALASALGSVVRSMQATGPAESVRWQTELVSEMSGTAGTLAELVPELATLLGDFGHATDLDAADSRRQLHRAIIRLLSATASYRPVVLAVDDLQWADQDTLLLLAELLTVSLRNVLLLGAHRAGEFDPIAAALKSDGLQAIQLEPLAREDVEELLADVCGRSVEVGDVAAEFHYRTGGNPLQVRQLFYRAQREGALTPVGPGGQPSWDLRVLTSIEVSATTAEFLARYLDQLRPTDREVLSSLACIGDEFDLDDAAAAAAQSPDVVARALWACLELRLIEALDARGQRITNAISRDAHYRFSHDRVAESARAGLSDDDARAIHLRIGRRLIALGDDRVFEAARHVSIAGLGLTDYTERTDFVEVVGRAARKARAQASFPLALDYCRSALDLLGEQRWATHFTLTRQLHLDAADAALLVGDVATLNALLDEAEEFLDQPPDRARIAYLRLKGRVVENRLQDALEIGLRALDELGERVAADAGKPRMGNAVIRMKMTMRRWSNERLLELPHCEDERVIALHPILAELCNMAVLIRPNILPLLVRKQLDLTLAHGHTPSSPLVIAGYGIVLVLLGDYEGAQRFGEVGRSLAARPEFREARPQTVFMHLDYIKHWRHPIRDGLGQLREAIEEALDQGDQENAGFLVTVLLSQSFWLGRPLAEIDALARSLIPHIRSQPVPSALSQGMQQICLNLMGRSDDPLLLAGESGYDEREILPAARREGDTVALAAAAAMRQGLHFWTGDHAGAVAATHEAMEHIDGLTGVPASQLVYMLGALSMIHSAPKDSATTRFVRRALSLHRKWAAGAPENYAAPYALIQGAWARAHGQNTKADRFFHEAIALAEENQLPIVGAYTHEEAAALYTETGRASLGEHMLRSAYQRWLNLGFVVRTDKLARDHPWLLRRDLTGSAGIDPVGAHQLLHSMSAARTADTLANIILGSVADTTGADRVLFLTGESEHLTVRAINDRGAISIVDGPWTEVSYDADVVRRVIEDGSPVIVAADRAATKPSTLAAPIILHDRIIGVVYAENGESGGVFSTVDQQAVAFLCAQAAAPLWNFQLEARLRAADEYRQSLIDVQSRFVPNELLRILDIDDLRRVRSGYRVEREMTVLISDIRSYTTMIEDMDVAEAGNLASGFMRAVEMPIIGYNGMIQDMRGDEIVAVFESEADAVRAGLGMLRSLHEHNQERKARGSEELRAGIGINTGTVGVGLVGGVNRMVLTLIGDAVNLAARIESTNKRYGSALLISDQTYRRIAHLAEFSARRMEMVRVVNRKKPVVIYEVYEADSPDLRDAKRAAQPAFDEAFALFDAGDVDAARAAFERCRALLPDDPVAPLHLAHCDAISRGELDPGQEIVLLSK